MKNIFVAGATGLIGQQVVRLLLEQTDVEMTALVRRQGALDFMLAGLGTERARKIEQVVSFSSADMQLLMKTRQIDAVICCIGTTIGKAGSKEAFQAVDRDIPEMLIAQLKIANPDGVFAFVSSVGADRPTGFYLNTKSEVENAIRQSDLSYVIARPSLLLGDRKEFRFGERIATAIAAPFFDIVVPIVGRKSRALMKYAPVEAAIVAENLIRRTLEALDLAPSKRMQILEGSDFYS